MNVLMGRPANKSTSLPPLTSGSDQGRHRERERERGCILLAGPVFISRRRQRHHIARPPTRSHSPLEQNKMKMERVVKDFFSSSLMSS